MSIIRPRIHVMKKNHEDYRNEWQNKANIRTYDPALNSKTYGACDGLTDLLCSEKRIPIHPFNVESTLECDIHQNVHHNR